MIDKIPSSKKLRSSIKITIGTRPVVILPPNDKRVCAVIQNISTTDVFIRPGTQVTTDNYTYKLTENAAYEINQTNLYTGPISAVTSSGTATILVMEW